MVNWADMVGVDWSDCRILALWIGLKLQQRHKAGVARVAAIDPAEPRSCWVHGCSRGWRYDDLFDDLAAERLG